MLLFHFRMETFSPQQGTSDNLEWDLSMRGVKKYMGGESHPCSNKEDENKNVESTGKSVLKTIPGFV